jgi:hypothetical protein
MTLELTRRRKIALGSILLLLLIWLLWPDRTLAKVRALRTDLADKSISPEDREAKVQQLRTTMQSLTPAQRNELMADGRRRATEEMERYHALSAAEKKQYLDQQIKQMEEMRQRMQQQQQQGGQANAGPRPGGGPGGFGNPQGGPQTPEDRERRRQQRLDNTTPRERELRDQFRKDMENRRRELGLPPIGQGGGRPPGGGRRP